MSVGRWERRRGLTLVEMIATITVLGVVGATVFPVIEASGAHFAESASLRRSADRVSFAIDRISRVLREIPAADEGDGLAIEGITASEIVLTDGTSIRLEGDRLLLEIDGRVGTICDRVSEFEIRATGADGVTTTTESPQQTRRIGIGIVAEGFSVRSAVFPRACMGGA
jgi:prepilin-type N-terminal cleavage/methylation domain-containing protein